MSKHTYDSRAYRKALALVQATGPTCHICGHPGSDSLDHRLSASLYPELRGDPANWVPCHGINGCPYCPPNTSRDKRRNGQPQRCNQAKGNKLELPRPPVTSRRW
jgi:5-methylcytosine-specific restriction endonuclease McrA